MSGSAKRIFSRKYGRVDAHVGLPEQQQEPLSCLHTLTDFRMISPRIPRKKIIVQESKTKVVARKSKLVIRKLDARKRDCLNPLSERASLTQKSSHSNSRTMMMNGGDDIEDFPLLIWSSLESSSQDNKHNENRFWK